jgi:4-oxalocrotonate tautomerase
MPHVIVKLWPGKSAEQKRMLSDAIVRDVTRALNYGDDSYLSHSKRSVQPTGRPKSTIATFSPSGTD